MTLAHLTLATQDVQRTCAFFEATVGWRPIHTPQNTPISAGWLEITPQTHDRPPQQVHVLEVEDFKPSPFEREFGRHVAILHPGSDFAALQKRLTAHGGELIDPIRPTPFDRFFFKDPNGYVFEVINREQYVVE